LILDFIDYILHLYSFRSRMADMAFKRSAVRSRLSPPKGIRSFIFYSFSPENEYFLCRNPNDVKSHAKLLKVDVKVDMQLVVPVDIHPLDKAVDDHLLSLNACGIVHISPRNNIVILSVLGCQDCLSLVIGRLCCQSRQTIQMYGFHLWHRVEWKFGDSLNKQIDFLTQ